MISFRKCEGSECKHGATVPHGNFYIDDKVFRFFTAIASFEGGIYLFKSIVGASQEDIPRITEEMRRAGLPRDLGKSEPAHRNQIMCGIMLVVDC